MGFLFATYNWGTDLASLWLESAWTMINPRTPPEACHARWMVGFHISWSNLCQWCKVYRGTGQVIGFWSPLATRAILTTNSLVSKGESSIIYYLTGHPVTWLNLHDSFLMVQRNMFTISVMFIMQHLYPGVSSSLLAKLLVKPDATIMTGAFELHGCSPNSDGWSRFSPCNMFFWVPGFLTTPNLLF